MSRQVKPWCELSPSGQRYRKMLWDKKISESNDVFWEGDVILPNDHIAIYGDLTVTGKIVAYTITVLGNFNANSISAQNVFVGEDLHAEDVNTTHGIQVNGDCYVNNIYNANFVVVKHNLYARYVNTVHTEVSMDAFIDLVVSKSTFKVVRVCDLGIIYSGVISCRGPFTADNVYAKIFQVKDSQIFGGKSFFDIREIPHRPYKVS